jgi:ubiquinone/menaquinone biosynthesis C-methylase UbiE
MFNWPVYAIASMVAALLFAFHPVFGMMALVPILLSVGASYCVYDNSALRNMDWLKEIAPSPQNILNVTAGYDEVTNKLKSSFANAEISVVDFLPATGVKTASITRASQYFPTSQPVASGTRSNWPRPDNGYELVLLWFAAHEARAAKMRDELFGECNRVVSQNGVIVIVEHLRNGANFCAYGPGARHFFPETEWRRSIHDAQLQIKKEFGITPFVKVFVLCR